ncbi:hypothetical protein IT409_00270 [Candidatus Falkowbacteria bacterium]|nr:hypothetical protein [Candidatus Falkowbacteria bacterium]
MLEQLFGSQTRVRLLQLFLNNPGQQFYVRELTRIIDSQINAVRREISNLVELGVVEEVEKEESPKGPKMKYYQVVPDFILYSELKGMIQKTQFIIEREFASDIIRSGDIAYFALTGSFVGEKHIPTDILMVGTIDKKKVNAVINKYEKQFNREINYTVLSAEEFNYRRNVADKFVYSILDGKKIVMIDKIFNSGASLV